MRNALTAEEIKENKPFELFNVFNHLLARKTMLNCHRKTDEKKTPPGRAQGPIKEKAQQRAILSP